VEDNDMKRDNYNLKILTYNIWNLNEPYYVRLNLLVDKIKTLNPDIIALQEVRLTNYDYPNNYKNNKKHGFQIEDFAKELPEYQYTYHPSMTYFTEYFYTQEGIAILSRYPIIDYSTKDLSRNFSDRADEHQRSVLHALIKGPAGLINIFSTHFSLSESARKRNLVELAEFVSTNSKGYPNIILGDFNSEGNTSAPLYIEGKFPLNGISLRGLKFKDAYKESIQKKYKK